MRAFVLLIVFTGVISCNNPETNQQAPITDTIILKQATVAEERVNPAKKSIAIYSVPIDDGMGNANNWKFAVNIYETAKTFEYKVNIQYKEIRATEMITIPNFGIAPAVSIKPGKSTLDCIIGFSDTKGLFKEYFQVSVKNDQLKFKKIKSYGVRTYKTKIS
ncbi:MAG: hypothetical protein Q7U77_13850 [Sediminibacterium sp.]|uniref:hypothetical protein n=1 Tax=Sediminibacterium sp. TaxID=1917865 RepID=UPI00271BC52E|nr:hypothetical protein [Sediminibacterium sp.]MDO8997704.1 hypothetical protein [Sediminibacterium sp.]